MIAWGILLALIVLAFFIGRWGGRRSTRARRAGALLLGASIPLLLFVALSIRDSIKFDQPLFDLASESGRFGFYVGGILALILVPIFLLATWLGLRNRKS